MKTLAFSILTLLFYSCEKSDVSSLSTSSHQELQASDTSIREVEELSDDYQGIAAIITYSNIRDIRGDSTVFSGIPMNQGKYNFCDSFPFSRQERITRCGGFLIDAQHVLTSFHCIDRIPKQDAEGKYYYEGACPGTVKERGSKIVFNFLSKYYNGEDIEIQNNNVFECKKVTTYKSDYGGNSSQFAILELDRKVSGIKPLQMDLNPPNEKYLDLTTFYFPEGVPLKSHHVVNWLADWTPSSETDDTIRLPIYSLGESLGLPIINSKTNKVIALQERDINRNIVLNREDSCLQIIPITDRSAWSYHLPLFRIKELQSYQR